MPSRSSGSFSALTTINTAKRLHQGPIEQIAEHKKLEAILGAMDCGVTIRDRDYVLTYQNDYAIKSMGVHLGEKCYEAFQQIDEICEGCPVKEAFADGQMHRSTRRVVMPSGEVTVWENIANPIRDAQGEIIACLEINRDITHLKRAEAQHQALQEQIWRAQRMEAIGQLAAGVAHDVNNLLCGISGLASVIQERFDSDDDAFGDLAAIVSSCDHGHVLTRKLLTLGRKAPFCTEAIQLDRVITEAVVLLERTLPRGIELQLSIDDALPPAVADAGQLSHVLINLALNAADAMEGEGTIVFAASARNVDAPIPAAFGPGTIQVGSIAAGAYVALEIRDEGVGIENEILEQVFEPFFTTKGAGKGTGLGLSMVRDAVLATGGCITIASAAGEGTTVSILLPRAAEVQAVRLPPVAKETENEPRRRGTVLVVDDEVFVRRAARRVLEKLGYRVLSAEDGAEAVEIYRAHHHDVLVVLLDLMMPVMSGADVFDELIRIDPEVKVLIASGYGDEHLEALVARGAKGLVRKPFTLKSLAASIDEAIDDSGPHKD